MFKEIDDVALWDGQLDSLEEEDEQIDHWHEISEVTIRTNVRVWERAQAKAR
jgi:hypothetical protein